MKVTSAVTLGVLLPSAVTLGVLLPVHGEINLIFSDS